MRRFVLLTGLLAAVGCAAQPSASSPTGPSAPPANPAPEADDPAPAPKRSGPTDDEVLAYLEGKKLPVPEDEQPLRFPRDKPLPDDLWTEIIDPSQIVAFERDSAIRTNDQPWECEVRFLYVDGAATYGVVGRVKYREVEGKPAFFGFEVTEVAKQ